MRFQGRVAERSFSGVVFYTSSTLRRGITCYKRLRIGTYSGGGRHEEVAEYELPSSGNRWPTGWGSRRKRLRYVLAAQDGAPETPRVKLTTGSARHRRDELCPVDTARFSSAESGRASGHGS